jgi:hypothetical protein
MHTRAFAHRPPSSRPAARCPHCHHCCAAAAFCCHRSRPKHDLDKVRSSCCSSTAQACRILHAACYRRLLWPVTAAVAGATASGSPVSVPPHYHHHYHHHHYHHHHHHHSQIPGPWRHAKPIVGNILECLRPDFHRKVLEWSNTYGGIYRMKFLWQDTLVVTDPTALAGVCAVCVCMCFDRPHVNGLSSVPLQLIQDPCLCSNSNDTSSISK